MIVAAKSIPLDHIHEIHEFHVAAFNDGTILVSLRDLAIGLGFTQFARDGRGNIYYHVGGERFATVLNDAGLLERPTDVIKFGWGKDYYVTPDDAVKIIDAAVKRAHSGTHNIEVARRRRFFREHLFLPVMFQVIDACHQLKGV